MRTSNVELLTSNIERKRRGLVFPAFDVQSWTLDVRSSPTLRSAFDFCIDNHLYTTLPSPHDPPRAFPSIEGSGGSDAVADSRAPARGRPLRGCVQRLGVGEGNRHHPAQRVASPPGAARSRVGAEQAHVPRRLLLDRFRKNRIGPGI